MTTNIPNAFVQLDIDDKNHVKGNRIIMNIQGPLVNMLCVIAPKIYESFVVLEGCDKKVKVLYLKILKAMYGMLQSSLLYYKKFQKDIESIGFKVNPYNPCIANQMVNGKQHTVTWHVDDLKSSHVDSKVNNELGKSKLSADTAMTILQCSWISWFQ